MSAEAENCICELSSCVDFRYLHTHRVYLSLRRIWRLILEISHSDGEDTTTYSCGHTQQQTQNRQKNTVPKQTEKNEEKNVCRLPFEITVIQNAIP